MKSESILTYIPTDRRHSLASGIPLPCDVVGSVLYADISGFTPLTERLAAILGARLGAEELSRQLNRVYDALVEVVDRYAGSIIGYSGDAMTVWFGVGHTPHQAARRAVTCALELQQAMHLFENVELPFEESVRISLKAVVASGNAKRFLVGDPSIQRIDVLVGDPLSRITEGEHCAQKGDVVIDKATVALLNGNCEITEWRDSDESDQNYAVVTAIGTPASPMAWAELSADRFTPEQLQGWIMPSVMEYEDEPLTELRPGVAVFVHFDGIDFQHDPDAEQKLDRFVRWVQASIVRYEGTLIQMTMGEKGSFIYFAFGALVAHENSPQRAAAAALDVRNLPPELSYIESLHIGISQGVTRTGAYGGKTRRTYGVLGDDVNFAARLMQHAKPGEILISGRMAREIAGEFAVKELEPIRVKGKQNPTPVALLLHKATESTPSVYERPLVGRSVEVAALETRLQPLQDGFPAGSTWVYGDAGIGKSHLVDFTRKTITTNHHVQWWTFTADQLVRQSLHAFTPLLHQYFNLDLANNEHQRNALFDIAIEALIHRLKVCVSPQGAEVIAQIEALRSFIGALMGVRWTGSAYENYDPKSRFERSLEGLVALLQGECLCKPLVIHIQDAQWLDPDSRSVVELLIKSALSFPMAVVVESREPLNEADMSDELLPQVYPVAIRELDEAGIAELVTLIFSGMVSERVIRYLANKANGNPFFTEQLTLDLRERKVIRQVDGMWSMKDHADDDVPVLLNNVLIARLDRLRSSVRQVVQVASVLGQEFEVPVLAKMIRSDPHIEQKVKQAEAETIWMPRNELEYIFRHALLRDAAYSMQLQTRLRELHALAGEAIEQLYADDLLIKLPDLAYHFERSAAYGRAVNYLIKAAQHMASLYINREAMRYYERAMRLAEVSTMPLIELAPIYEGMGDMYDASGEYLQATIHFDIALAYVNAEHPAWRSRLHRKKGQVLQRWGRYDEATHAFEAGLKEMQHDLHPDEACQIYSGMSMIHYRQGQLEDALELAKFGLMMANMQADKRNLAYANQILGIVHWKMDEYDASFDYYQTSLSLWQEAHSTIGLAAVQNNLGLLYQSKGDLNEAIARFEVCLKLFEQVGNLHGMACAYDNLGQAYMQRGEQDLAMSCLENAVGILAKIGLDESEVFTSMWQSGIW